MNTQITRRKFATLATSTLALPYLSRAAFAAGDAIKIGMIAPTEGQALKDGREYTKGLETAIQHVNETGGILGGRPVEMVFASQGTTGETARSAALKLAQREGVHALVGPHWADTAPAGLSVAQRYNLPFAPDQGGMWLYDQGYPGTLGLSCNARARTMPQLRWLEEKGIESVVMLMVDIDYNRDVEKLVRERWERADSPVKLLDIIYYPWGSTQLDTELTKAVGQSPDFIWAEEWSAQVAASMLKKLNDLNYSGEVSVTADLTQDDVDNMPTELTEGVYSKMDWAPDASVPANAAFLDLWTAKYGEGAQPWRSAEVIYAQSVFLMRAMDLAGTEGNGRPDGLEAISKAMRELEWVAPTGDAVVLSDRGLGILPRTPLVQVRGGKIEIDKYLDMTPNDWLAELPDDWAKL
ncbi:ABC transporter substrate-binding protein [Pseudoprimorskyibacter insulae]|uniref:Aliphatic amidase expression-regulating protein n=1 Tax=Pseudoprimorskyibacter insulae TaxID=1695997 RepID=A0A2R8AZS5_9RHOB|nr:ABC transporter substrate-binding protein [Pseudoprimorskyibacter insulae]SPF81530.1 Aliphatic amidase expression-regulating protein [Pseudoprimorskyibacter insulae]